MEESEKGKRKRERERGAVLPVAYILWRCLLCLLTVGRHSHHDGHFRDLTLVQLHDSHRALPWNMNEDTALSVRLSLRLAVNKRRMCARVILTCQCVFFLINTSLHMGNFIICMWLFACALLCAAERRQQARMRACTRGRWTKTEAWNDNAAVHCQRMWSQIKATRLPLSLFSLPAAFPDRRMKGEVRSFSFWIIFSFGS